MKIITDKNECQKLIKNCKNSIFDSYKYKKFLNKHYDPDAYLFFVEGEDVIPLVVKNNLVTFFGGPQFNNAHKLPNNKVLLNSMLSYLKKEDYRFQLISIYKDSFNLLNKENKCFDVPYPAEWHYEQIQQYDKVNILKLSSGKKRKRLKLIINKYNDYTFTTLPFSEFKTQFNVLIQKHINYFSARGKTSVWQGKEDFLLKLLTFLNNEELMHINIIKLKQEIVGISILVYNNEELVGLFASSLKQEDHNISKIIYLNMLKTAKEISIGTKITNFNAMRGAFTNKKRFGFTPVPLYALVKDTHWIVQTDKDIDSKSYKSIYGRSHWGQEGCR